MVIRPMAVAVKPKTMVQKISPSMVLLGVEVEEMACGPRGPGLCRDFEVLEGARESTLRPAIAGHLKNNRWTQSAPARTESVHSFEMHLF
jgi:hypothetical protein